MPYGIARFPLLSLRDIFPRRGGSLSSQGELIALPQALRLSRKLYRYARGSLPEGAGKAVRLCLRELSSRFPCKKHRLPVRKAVLFSTFFCPVVENPVQF